MLIKRYQNRKLYNTETSSYITLSDIATYVREGKSFFVLDNKTKSDITEVTLGQVAVRILFNQAGNSEKYKQVIITKTIN